MTQKPKKYITIFVILIGSALFFNGISLSKNTPETMDPVLFKNLEYRFIGPYRGGRVTAVTGVPDEKYTFFMGSTGGGVWKTTDGGIHWTNISDGFFQVASIGSIEVALSDPNVMYVGTGSASPRGNISTGRGIYKSADGGQTWELKGLETEAQIGKIQIHPKDPDVVYAAVLGNIFGPGPERGVFRTLDGGESWEKVLFVDDRTGCVDMVMDPNNPRILYAGMWQAERKPWTLIDGGEHGGVYKTTDGGETWNQLKGGLPTGVVGRVGVAVSPVNPMRVWVIQESADEKKGGIYLSENGGKKWRRINRDHRFRQRAWYYSRIFADPVNEHTVYVLNTGFYKSLNDGEDFRRIRTPHGDNHCLWINPHNPDIMIQSNDGGANVTYNGGRSWSSQSSQPTAEIYRLSVDHQFPYRVYGCQQDNSSLSLSSQGRPNQDFYAVGGGESGHVAVDPRDPDIIYAGNYIGILTRLDRKRGHYKRINAYPELDDGIAGRDLKYRFQWNFPIRISPHDSDVLYITSNYVHRSTDEGQIWEVISPDLTQNIDDYLGRAGGPIQHDCTGVETYSTIFAFEESPLEKGVLWTGSDDGLVHVSKDGGQTWNNVTPKNMPKEGTINMFDVSSKYPGQVLMAVYRYRDNDFHPYVFRTDDYGRSWALLTDGKNGIPEDYFVRAVREDPDRRGLLYAGTEFGMFVSFDDGKHWQELQLNLPVTPVTDLMVYDQDLIVSTQGRGFWILDDLSVLGQLEKAMAEEEAVLFQPEKVYRTQVRGPLSRLSVYYYLKDKPESVKIEVLDQDNHVIRTFDKIKTEKGMNQFTWNLTHKAPEKIKEAVISLSYTGGPKAVPGTYKVRLTCGQEKQVRNFRVLKDPRWEDITVEDLKEQFDLQVKVGQKFTLSHDLIKKIRDIREQVQSLSSRAVKAGFKEVVKNSADDLLKKLNSLEQELIQTKNESRQDPINYQVKLDNQLAYLYSAVHSQDSKPTQAVYQRYEDLDIQLSKAEKRFQNLIENEIGRFEKLLEENDIPRIIIK
ncbi:MAG: glycosyl hydrolase [Candidatus Aminicenantes bacterium]|nr:glycosyl hydrolase [Candidatus Aminicenantes bacterium]